jgi:outer membrane protein assembly factor BamB
MDDVLDRLRRMADVPPTAPEPLDGLRRRALRLRRRRWAAGGVALSLAVAASVAGLTLADGGSVPVAVEVGDGVPSTTGAVSTTDAPATTVAAASSRQPVWRVAASISGSSLPSLVGPEAAGDVILVPGGTAGGGVTAYDAGTGAQRWRYDTGSAAFVRAVGDGIAVVAPQYGSIAGVELTSGQERWRLALPAGASAGRAAVVGSRVYVGASYPSEGALDAPVVYALDASTGQVAWSRSLERGTQLQFAPPVVADGWVLVADTPHHPGSAPSSHVHAIDAASGAVRWRADLGSDRSAFHDQSPLVAGGVVYAVSNAGLLLAVDATSGRERWRRQSSSGIVMLAGAAEDGVLAVVGSNLVSLDAGDGAERWQVATAARWGSSWTIPTADTVIVVEPGRTFAADVASGRVRWERATDAVQPPAYGGGVLYVSGRSALHAIQTGTGRAEWTGEVQGMQFQPTLVTPATVAVAASDGSLVAFPR